jgi:hypothetical protein
MVRSERRGGCRYVSRGVSTGKCAFAPSLIVGVPQSSGPLVEIRVVTVRSSGVLVEEGWGSAQTEGIWVSSDCGSRHGLQLVQLPARKSNQKFWAGPALGGGAGAELRVVPSGLAEFTELVTPPESFQVDVGPALTWALQTSTLRNSCSSDERSPRAAKSSNTSVVGICRIYS